ncbi:hypothetical protein BKA70DRAFT_1437380 [Coprinopsis sp. MPI-PUGE-AT-0042]|nr:hypothetical protein BKA70DRAFT_1437380 [Coprinopsis sp. MPI-PUGE-AT-0042]
MALSITHINDSPIHPTGTLILPMTDQDYLVAPRKHILYRLTLRLQNHEQGAPPVATLSLALDEHCHSTTVWDLGLPCDLWSFIERSDNTWCFDEVDEHHLLHATNSSSNALLDMSQLPMLIIEYPTDLDEPIYNLASLVPKVALPPRVLIRPLQQGQLPLSTPDEIEEAKKHLISALRQRKPDYKLEVNRWWKGMLRTRWA